MRSTVRGPNRYRPGRFALVAIVLALGCGATKLGSIGAVLERDRESGALFVHETPPGLAAERAGLEPGDRVKMIDGQLVDDLDRKQIQALLRGPIGSSVTLTVIRGDRVLELPLSREALLSEAELPERHERVE